MKNQEVSVSTAVNLARGALLLFAAMAGNIAYGQESTQAKNIIRPVPDSNGVDLVTGGLYVSEPSFSAPGAGNLQLQVGRTDKANEINTLKITLSSYSVNEDPEQMWPRRFTIAFNGSSANFWCGDEFANCEEFAPRRGAAFHYVSGGNPSGFTYTTPDGTVVKFPYSIFLTDIDATEMLYPSGEKFSIQTTYGPSASRVLTSNLGYTVSIVGYGNETRRLYKGGTGGTLLNTITTATQDVVGQEYTRTLTDDLGRTSRIRYVPGGSWCGYYHSLAWFEDPTGLRTTVNYHAQGGPFYSNLLVSAITRNGNTWSYSPVINYTTRQITDPAGAVREVRSEPTNYSFAFSPNGTCSQSTHPDFGSVISDKTPLGQTTSYTYYNNLTNEPAWDHLASATLPEGNKYKYDYDGRGNVTKTTEVPKSGGSGKTLYQASYPATCSNPKTCNKPQWTRDSAGAQTDFTYDATHGGLLTKLEPADTNGKRRKKWNEYEAHNTGNGTVYRLSATHLCSIDSIGANYDCQTAAERVTRYTYWGSTFLPLTETRTNGTNSVSATTTNSYDNWGRLLSIVDPTGMANYFRYDVMGRKTWEIASNGAGSWVAKKYTYDNADQITRTDRGTLTDPNSASLQIMGSTISSYDVEHRLTKNEFVDATYGRSSVQQFSYDSGSRLVCAVQRMNPSAFDSTSDACAVGPSGTAGSDRVTKLTYNLDGRATKIVEGFGVLNGGLGIVEKETGYTNNGNLKWHKDGNGNQTDYFYDDYDRLYRSRFPDLSFEQSEYDSANRLWRFTKRNGQYLTNGYDGASRLTSTSYSNGESTISRDYDGQGRPTTISRGGQTTTYAHGDALGRLSSETQPAGVVSYSYDLADRQTRITWPSSYWVDYDYNSAGSLWRVRELGATSGLGVVATWTFDGLGRRATLSRGNGAVTTLARDADDRLLSLAHDVAGSSLDIQYLFERNPASQISARTYTNSAWAWTLPASANVGYSPDALNRYTTVGGVTFSYDGNGNLAYDGSRTYGYDFSSHLISASGGGAPSAVLAYDPQGRLFSVASNGVTTRFLYDGVRVIAAYDGIGNLQQRYVPGVGTNMPLLSLTGTATAANSASTPNNANWLMGDERGSVIALTNASGTPAINKYGPYGEPHASNQGRFGYTGQLWIPEVGLYHYRARDYNPVLGRFMQTDPIGYEDGLNLYAYVHNDPLNFSDPTGTQGTYSAQAEEERQRQMQREKEQKPQSAEPQKVKQPKDSPYEEDGFTLKKPVEVLPSREKESEHTREERWKKAEAAAKLQNDWENAAAEAARKKDWAAYNELMNMAANEEREYMKRLYGKPISPRDVPQTRSPVPSESK